MTPNRRVLLTGALVVLCMLTLLGLITRPRILDLHGDALATRQATFGCPWRVGAGLYGTVACVAVPNRNSLEANNVYDRNERVWILKIYEDGTVVLLVNLNWREPNTSSELHAPPRFFHGKLSICLKNNLIIISKGN
jgi:hypothetical protein